MDLTASHPHLGTGTASARLTPLGFDIHEAVADSRARARPGEAPVGSSGGTYYIGRAPASGFSPHLEYSPHKRCERLRSNHAIPRR